MPMLVGCIADDFTGATDLANTFVRQGLSALQLIGVPGDELPVSALDQVDVLVVALKSRTTPAAEAVAESLAALAWLRQRGAPRIYFKVCSTFDSTPRGNIGPVAEALMQALGCDFSIATPAFPENGRTVFQGHLFVGDGLLSDSSMRHHPLTPMTDASLVRVLQAQSAGKVGLVNHRAVAAGCASIRERMAQLRAEGHALAIVDATSDDDLIRIGEAVVDAPLVTAGSGLALGLARALGGQPGRSVGAWPVAVGRAAVVAGSCSAMTQRQVQHHQRAGHPSFEVDALQIAAGVDVVRQALAWAQQQATSVIPLIFSTADAARVQAVQQQLGTAQAGEQVEGALSAIALGLVNQGVRRLVVAGGETSGACVKALGVRSLRIGPQIAPGVPWCHASVSSASETSAGLHLSLKSGNFGSEGFFTEAFDVLAGRATSV